MNLTLPAAVAVTIALGVVASSSPARAQTQSAQMSRDVTDAVRKQRAQQKPPRAARPQRARRCNCDK